MELRHYIIGSSLLIIFVFLFIIIGLWVKIYPYIASAILFPRGLWYFNRCCCCKPKIENPDSEDFTESSDDGYQLGYNSFAECRWTCALPRGKSKELGTLFMFFGNLAKIEDVHDYVVQLSKDLQMQIVAIEYPLYNSKTLVRPSLHEEILVGKIFDCLDHIIGKIRGIRRESIQLCGSGIGCYVATRCFEHLTPKPQTLVLINPPRSFLSLMNKSMRTEGILANTFDSFRTLHILKRIIKDTQGSAFLKVLALAGEITMPFSLESHPVSFLEACRFVEMLGVGDLKCIIQSDRLFMTEDISKYLTQQGYLHLELSKCWPS